VNRQVWVEIDPTKLIQDFNRIYIRLTTPIEPPTSDTDPSGHVTTTGQEDPSSEGATGTSPYAEAEAAARASIEPRFTATREPTSQSSVSNQI
jgi:hypothetical protein